MATQKKCLQLAAAGGHFGRFQHTTGEVLCYDYYTTL